MCKQSIIISERKPLVKPLSKLLIIVLLTMAGFHFASASSHWKAIAAGVTYRDSAPTSLSPWSHIHTFKINLKQNEINLVLAKDLHHEFASAADFARQDDAILAVNGGFFDNHYRPLGLRIQNSHPLSPIKPISWWGVFSIRNNNATISSYHQFQNAPGTSFAIQTGPRLLINGKIPTLKPGRAERTALGINRQGEVILIVTEYNPLTTTELAQLLQKAPLNCIQALNLDGGSSSQLYTKTDNLTLSVHGFSQVSDGIIVTPKVHP